MHYVMHTGRAMHYISCYKSVQYNFKRRRCRITRYCARFRQQRSRRNIKSTSTSSSLLSGRTTSTNVEHVYIALTVTAGYGRQRNLREMFAIYSEFLVLWFFQGNAKMAWWIAIHCSILGKVLAKYDRCWTWRIADFIDGNGSDKHKWHGGRLYWSGDLGVFLEGYALGKSSLPSFDIPCPLS